MKRLWNLREEVGTTCEAMYLRESCETRETLCEAFSKEVMNLLQNVLRTLFADLYGISA